MKYLTRQELLSPLKDSPIYSVLLTLLDSWEDLDISELRRDLSALLPPEMTQGMLSDLQPVLQEVNRQRNSTYLSKLLLVQYILSPEYRLRQLVKMKNKIRKLLLEEVIRWDDIKTLPPAQKHQKVLLSEVLEPEWKEAVILYKTRKEKKI